MIQIPAAMFMSLALIGDTEIAWCTWLFVILDLAGLGNAGRRPGNKVGISLKSECLQIVGMRTGF